MTPCFGSHSVSDWGHWSCWGVPQSSEGQLHEGQAPSALPGGGSLQGELHGFGNCSLYCEWMYLFFFPLYFKQNKLSLCCLVLAVKFPCSSSQAFPEGEP